MKKNLSKTSIKAFTLSLLFLLSGAGSSVLMSPVSAAVSHPVVAATPLSPAEANWAYSNGNQMNQDYNPQTQINSSNAQYLGLNWLFPLPVRPPALTDYNGAGGLGVGSSVLIINGTVYAITNFDQIFALNAANGDVIWTDILPITLNSTVQGAGALSLHAHDGIEAWTTSLFNHTPTLWLQGNDNKVWAINAQTGAYELNFTDFTGLNMVQGNSPTSSYNGVGAANIIVDQNRGILITSHGAELFMNNGRCFYRGWNLKVNPPTPLWTSYCTPPQTGSAIGPDPYWSIKQVNNMSSAEVFFPGVTASNGYSTTVETQGGVMMNVNNNMVVQLKSLSSTQLNATLYNDWGQVGQTGDCKATTGGESTGSTGAGWGGAWILGSGQASGMAFVNTNNKDPWVGPCNPGPDLWAASLLALNETTGAWIWGFQATAHDIWDWDCSWWQAQGTETINGASTPVIWKTCKNGFLYEVNALTGNLIWAWDPPSNYVARCNVCYMMNPLNRTQMTAAFPTQILKQPLIPGKSSFLQFPSASAGFEDEQAYSPATNMLYVAAQNVPNYVTYIGINASTYAGGGFAGLGETFTPVTIQGGCAGCGPQNNNATIFGIDASTGAVVWHYFVPLQGYRGGVMTSGNLVFLTLSSGDLIMLNGKTGQLVNDYYVGGPLNILASVGATQSGQEEIIFPITAGLVTWATGVPGDLVALNLKAVPASVVTTVTASASTTTTTATSTATTTATTTITATPTSTGVSTTTAYGIAAVAVIFIIATGYLAMRGRKPAS